MTEHFKATEFAQRRWEGGPAVAYPAEWLASRLKPLCETLEVIRAEFDKPVTILSGYRSPAFNGALKGAARRSQHMLGRAADIRVKGVSAKVVRDTIHLMILAGRLPLVKGLGEYPTFTHVDIRESKRLATWSGSRKDN
jgi:uncharacterized protein YcbK (DUF882 family)